MSEQPNMMGKRFGRLRVIAHAMRRGSDGAVQWICYCDCGRLTIVRGASLRAKLTRSCGCLKRDPELEMEVGRAW